MRFAPAENSELLRVYVFRKTAAGEYDPATLEDVTAKARGVARVDNLRRLKEQAMHARFEQRIEQKLEQMAPIAGNAAEIRYCWLSKLLGPNSRAAGLYFACTSRPRHAAELI